MRLVIFLDDGGVLSDNAVRAQEWRRLIGEFLSPHLGGEPAAWAEANAVVFQRQWERFEDWQKETASSNEYTQFFEKPHEQERWISEMSELVGVGPLSSAECQRWADETQAYVRPRVRAAYPEAKQAVLDLAARGHVLMTASGQTSDELEDYLGGMSVREHFAPVLYGPDIVRALKHGPHFHSRCFAHAGVEPSDAVVVDDSPAIAEHAHAAGAVAVLLVRDGAAPSDTPATVIQSLAGLPPLVETLA